MSVPSYVSQFAVPSFAYTTLFSAIDAAKRIAAPTLGVHSEIALAPSLASPVARTVKSIVFPCRLLQSPPCRQGQTHRKVGTQSLRSNDTGP
jgi:hypothetical protein